MENPGLLKITDQASIDDAFFNRPIDNIDLGRESLPIFDYDTSFGRESLGILKLGCDIPLVEPSQRSTSYFSEMSQNVFDQAFISSPRPSEYEISPCSLNSANFSYKMKGFDQPSSIKLQDSLWSIQTRITDVESVNKLNDAFLYTSGLKNLCHRSRFHSLPVYSTKKSDLENELLVQQMLNRISEGCYNNNDCLKSTLNIDTSDNFNDSVFIEARHLSSRFSEGSNDGYMLDETEPPELINEEIEENESDKKCDKEEVFKKIEKLFPNKGYKKLDEKNPIEIPKKPVDLVETVSISPEVKENDEYNRKKSEGDRNSEDILGSLSNILSKDILSESESEQGKTLLNTIAVILGNKSRERSKSFSNSSLGNIHEISKSQHDSTKRAVSKPVMLKRHSNSFSHPTKTLKTKLVATSSGKVSSFDKSKDSNNSSRTAGSFIGGNNEESMSKRPNSLSSASEASVELRNMSANSGGGASMNNLKMKRGVGNVRRGPLKATVPVENFTRIQPKATPPKAQQKLPKLQSRISTPIREVQLKPMAQSTPDNNNKVGNSSIEQNNQRSFTSPNVRDKSNNYSSLANSLSSCKESSLSKDNSSAYRSQLPRRNSLSEGRTTISSKKNSNSSLKESGLMKALTKLRQNLSNSINNQSKSALKDRSNVSVNDNMSNTSEKNLNTSKKMIRSFGKENVSLV